MNFDQFIQRRRLNRGDEFNDTSVYFEDIEAYDIYADTQCEEFKQRRYERSLN